MDTAMSPDSGFGDLYIQPINLGWHKKRIDYVAGLGVYMPTARYEENADDNLGLGMWSFEAFGGTTYFFDDKKSWHISALASYEIHSEKEDSSARVGDILTIEGGAGKSLLDGALMFGVAYSAQWKLTNDDFDGLLPTGAVGKHHLFSVGPELVVPVFATEKLFGLLGARYLFDFDAESTTEGETLVVTLTVGTL